MEIEWKVPETKSQFIANCIEEEVSSGKLAVGSRLPPMRAMAEHFSVSLQAIQSAFGVLSKKGLIDCRHGSGTFIRDRKTVSRKKGSSAVYFLTPNPIHTTLQFEPSIIDRRIIYGASMNTDGCLIHNIPVYRKREEELHKIDWTTVNQIPEGANVFVTGSWYRKLFPFLKKRKARVIYRASQYELNLSEDLKHSICPDWYTFVTDRADAAKKAVEYLHGLGRRRIGFIKFHKNEPLHPFRIGVIGGYENCGMTFDERMYHEVPSSSGLVENEDEIQNEIVEFWKKARFDSLVIGNAVMFKTVYNTLTAKLGLRIPDDLALISFTDQPAYLHTEIPVSAIDFHWVGIGQKIVKCFKRNNFTSGKAIFQAQIIERESTRKGAGAFVNHDFLPELSVNKGLYH